MPLIATEAISKRYRMGDVDVGALVDVTLTIEPGEAVAIMGPSGSGKSTLMNLLGCLDTASSGRYLLDGQDVGRLSRTKLAAVRNRQIGFIFQSFNLLARATALENVELPLIYAGWGGRRRRRRALELLEAVGLADRAHHRPSQLSGGEQQRVAIARALANGPKLLLADEPTGSLDSQSSKSIMRLLGEISARGLTLVLITHDGTLAATMPRVIALHDGRVVSDTAAPPESNLVTRYPSLAAIA
jgi:putative ABC transport system ATP-binding protein